MRKGFRKVARNHGNLWCRHTETAFNRSMLSRPSILAPQFCAKHGTHQDIGQPSKPEQIWRPPPHLSVSLENSIVKVLESRAGEEAPFFLVLVLSCCYCATECYGLGPYSFWY